MLRRKEQGFTLIELMIVVAIIGILAAIAIPNFLQYQLKSKQTEAKTNLGGIRTNEVAFAGERGCFLATPQWPAGAAAAGAKTPALAWMGPPAPAGAAAGTLFCVAPPGAAGAATAQAVDFNDIGYQATGTVSYRYSTNAIVNAAGVVTPLVPGAGACAIGGPRNQGGGNVANNGFQAFAESNLDGDGSVSVFGVSDASGVLECTPGGTF